MQSLLRILFFFLLVVQISFGQGYWTKVGDMPENRYAHTIDEINGKIYIVGGFNNETGVYPTTALVFDRSSLIWSQISLPESKLFHTSCVVDNKLFVIGGYPGNPTTGKIEMFDPNSSVWISKNPMPTPRWNLTCASIENKIYVVGGANATSDGLKTLEVYDTANDTWTQLADMPTGRWGLEAVAFNGKIYVFGGTYGLATIVYASVEVYDPQTNTWTTKSNMPTKRYQLTPCILDSNIFAIGGWLSSNTGPIYNKVEIYNPESDIWSSENPLPVARALLASIVLDGKIYVYGGSRTNHPLIGTSAIYEFSREDIFALQPSINKSYAGPNIDSVLFITRFSNLNNHSFTPNLIYANTDSTHMDSLILFDDGLHGDSLSNDGLYGGYIPPRLTEDFFILGVSTIDNQTNKYYNTPDRCRFTTAGPVVLDSIFCTKSGTNYLVKVFLRNESSTTTITNTSVKLICNDAWVLPITNNVKNLPNIPPGGTVSNSTAFTISYIDSLFLLNNCFNFKVEVMSGGWTYWKDSKQVVVGVEEENNEIPTEFSLKQNYPNPFNPITKIKYSIPKSSQVSLKIFNTLGEELKTLVNEEKPVGTYEVNWNASNLPSGVYFCRLQAGSFVQTRKMILLK